MPGPASSLWGIARFLHTLVRSRPPRVWADALRAAGREGVTDVVAAYRTAAVFADPETTDLAELECWLRAVVPIETPAMTGRRFVVPVLYDGADLPLVASRMRSPRPR